MQNFYAVLGLILLLFLVFKVWQLWRLYRTRLRMKLEKLPPELAEIKPRDPEIIGKVRVVPRMSSPVAAADAAPVRPVIVPPEPALVPESVSEPVAMPNVLPEAVDEPVLLQAGTPEADEVLSEQAEPPVLLSPVLVQAPVEKGEQQDMFAGEPVAPRPEPTLAAQARALYEVAELEPVNALGGSQEKNDAPLGEVEDVIAVHVICRGVPFHGEDLLRAILSYGLRFGEMSIFHRHEQPTGQGAVLFSMAQAVEPGTFDLETMTTDSIAGVSFFLSLPGINSIHAYDIMVDTAKRLAIELHGDMLDQQQSPMTRQLLEHYRERVTEFERRRLAGRSR